ncbi:hypothetical protein M0802_009402 [Mischocyttarus mexicanus]|nr:hypothetical protein M0802_009402 [Mischocyttarus mexicanus]
MKLRKLNTELGQSWRIYQGLTPTSSAAEGLLGTSRLPSRRCHHDILGSKSSRGRSFLRGVVKKLAPFPSVRLKAAAATAATAAGRIKAAKLLLDPVFLATTTGRHPPSQPQPSPPPPPPVTATVETVAAAPAGVCKSARRQIRLKPRIPNEIGKEVLRLEYIRVTNVD